MSCFVLLNISCGLENLITTGVGADLLAVNEEDGEYEYEDSTDDEHQRKSSVEEDELSLMEEGDKASIRNRKTIRYSAQFYVHPYVSSRSCVRWSVFFFCS